MSKKFKSQASSARAASGFGGFGAFQTAASPLSYIAEQPDLSNISEPSVVVALKNLGKKDSTTKAKALEELLESLKDNVDVPVLSAWSDLYPRTSIDNSQIVRRNAHVLQGNLTVNAGKKIAPYLPKIVPSWLAGTYDSDKSVAKAAGHALDRSFSTPEKKIALWKLYKDAIYERVQDALLTQSATTLSDERTTSSDEAETKYVRVVGTGLRLLSQLIQDGFDHYDMLSEKKLWEYVHHDDSYLRNATCGLLITALAKDIDDLDWTVLSTTFLYKALNKNQTGSSRAFAQALCKLTEVHPTVWTIEYVAKTAVSKRLLHYLRSGSQSGPQDVWMLLITLVKQIPKEAWKQSVTDSNALAEAYRTGVLGERLYIDAAWSSYVELCSWLLEHIEAVDERDSFIEQNLIPMLTSYVSRSSDEKWRIGGRSDRSAENALRAISEQSNVSLEKAWTAMVDATLEKMRLSLPESSKDFRMSQDAVAAQSKRLFGLHQKAGTTRMPKVLRQSLLEAALELLLSRNGKPYGAACIIEDVVRNSDTTNDTLQQALTSDLARLLDSPSSEQIVLLAMQFGKPVGLALFQSNTESTHIVRGREYFLRSAPQTQFQDNALCELILSKIDGFKSEMSRALAVSLLANPQLSDHQLKSQVLSALVNSINLQEDQDSALSMLETLSTQPAITSDLMQSDSGPQLSSRLLLLVDSADLAISERSSALVTMLNSNGGSMTNTIPIIRQQLRGEGESLSILTLADLGLRSITEDDASDLLPDPEDWRKALKALCHDPMDSSLSITSPLHGAVWLIEAEADASETIKRDAEDFSQVFRMVFFITKVFANGSALQKLGGPRMDALYRYFPICLEVVNEKLTLDDANKLWLGSTVEVLLAASDIMSEGTQLLMSWLDNDSYVQEWLLRGSELEAMDRETYFTALAYHRVVSRLFELRPQEVVQTYDDSLYAMHKSHDILESSALLSASSEYILGTSGGLKMVNELLSEVTQVPSHFSQIALLNVLVVGDPSVLGKVPQQRVVFLFKSIVGHLKQAESDKLLSETLRLIALTVPYVLSIYSEVWDELIQQLIVALAAPDIAVIHSSLLAYAQVKRALKADEVNDDLVSAWSSEKQRLDEALLVSLRSLSTPRSDVDQPRSITAELLRRQLDGVVVPDNVDVFALLNSGQASVQLAAYDLLHRSIPSKQEQLSIDLALDQRVAELPTELLQLIADADETQRYLLGWKLVFDHFPKASYRLREAYSSNLKSTGAIEHLLDFLCERLRITSGRPLDASKLQIADYEVGVAESTEQDTQWLSVHIYYQALLFTPSLAKDWFLQQKNRIKQPLENWTQKHISPLIVASSIATVNEWSTSQAQDDRPVEIKASPRGAEIVASIAVDPESPPIALSISLPSAYPLESPVVTSRARVGVSDKNWTSWLRTFQIIIFSSGSIIEGLVAFRRNVQGALKGQSECAICYSIIGTDMQTPNKKCGTCKNMFHGVCLFRWFKSSNSSSCPLCRNNFNYA